MSEIEIRNGGQTGVDQASSRAAVAVGFPTAMLMPRGFLTEDGPRPGFAKLYNAREHPSPHYPPRTRRNIEDAHATLIVSDREDLTGGTKLTYDHAYRMGQKGAGLYLAVLGVATPAEVADWIRECVGERDRFILNVAGPRESGCPGIGERAEAFLVEVFRILKGATSA